jgi:hypothetical protein
MLIIGCDFHTRYQQIAMAEDQTGELLLERRLDHEAGAPFAVSKGCESYATHFILNFLPFFAQSSR